MTKEASRPGPRKASSAAQKISVGLQPAPANYAPDDEDLLTQHCTDLGNGMYSICGRLFPRNEALTLCRKMPPLRDR